MPQPKALRFLKRNLFGLLVLFSALGIVYWLLPKGSVDQMTFDDPWGQEREMVSAKTHGVVAATPWLL